MSREGEMSPAAAPPLEDDDLLTEILLRLPPQPSSLPRASLVCKRWRSLVSDTGFFRRFRLHHRHNPPLLGFFNEDDFVPNMEAPNRLPYGRLSLPLDREEDDHWIVGCRHGLVLIFDRCSTTHPVLVVWDPVAGDQHRIAVPAAFDADKISLTSGAVLRGAGLVQFQVVLVAADKDRGNGRILAWVYLSDTGVWGDPITTLLPSLSSDWLDIYSKPAVLVGNSLYWLLIGASSRILKFDLNRQRLAVIPRPLPVHMIIQLNNLVLRADGGGLGFLFMSGNSIQLRSMKTDCDGVASWVLTKTYELDKLLPVNYKDLVGILGFAEYNNVLLLDTYYDGLFMIQLESSKFKKLSEFLELSPYHAFESVYNAGMGIGGGHVGAQLLHDTKLR